MIRHLNFAIQAYIPKSLGKPLLSYFEKSLLFSPKFLKNYSEFKSKLARMDKLGGTWIAEPGTNMLFDTFFMTDNQDFHNKAHSNHSFRLNLQGQIDLNKIGSFTNSDKTTIFRQSGGKQLSDESHRLTALIINPQAGNYSPYGFNPVPMDYVGYCSDIKSMRSEQFKVDFNVSNISAFPHALPVPGLQPNNFNQTIMNMAASAGYPFLEPASPNIDIELEIKLIKHLKGGNLEVIFNCKHDRFPAYELVVNNQLFYSYNPKDHGYTGPTPYNLNFTRSFTRRIVIPQ